MKKVKEIISDFHKKKDGIFTIEMSIIFPAIFFSLLLVLFIGMVLYQEVNLQSLAVQASERGSVVYCSHVSDMATGKKTLDDFTIHNPYRNVPFLGEGDKKAYTNLVNQYVAAHIGHGDILSREDQNGGNYTTIEDYLIMKRVKVNIHSGYHTPMDSVAEMFGHKGPFDINTTAVSAVVDSPDFVRNVDIIVDIASQSKLFGSVQEGYGKIKDAIQKVADLLN